MPIIKPKKYERRNDFIKRFMRDKRMKQEYKENKQRLAVAYSTWRKNNE